MGATITARRPFGAAMDPAHRSALEALRPDWLDLMARDPRATPFQSPAWCIAWWEHLGGGDLALLQARAGGRLIGLLPGFVWAEDGRRQLMPLGLSHGDYQDVLIDPDRADAAWAGLAEAACADGRFDCIVIPDARPEAWARMSGAGWRAETADGAPCPTLCAGPDGLMAAVPASKRRDLRMARNRADAAGAVAIRTVDAAGVAGALDALFGFSAARWAGDAALDPAAVRRFHRGAAPALAAEGRLRMTVLTIDGAIGAVCYGLRDAAAHYAFLCAYDPSDPRQSFGALLIEDAIRAADSAGARAYHFLRGGEAHKYRWGAADRFNARVTLWPA